MIWKSEHDLDKVKGKYFSLVNMYLLFEDAIMKSVFSPGNSNEEEKEPQLSKDLGTLELLPFCELAGVRDCRGRGGGKAKRCMAHATGSAPGQWGGDFPHGRIHSFINAQMKNM